MSRKRCSTLGMNMNKVTRMMSDIIQVALTFTCSKSTIETLEKDMKYVQSWQNNTRATPLTSFWCLNISQTLFWCFHCWLWPMNADWEPVTFLKFASTLSPQKIVSVFVMTSFSGVTIWESASLAHYFEGIKMVFL